MDDGLILPARHKIDVDAYHRMAEAGIFAEGDRVELIDGELIDMMPIGQGHMAVVNGLTEALVLACQGRAIVSVQNSVRIDRLNEPQPDFTIFRRRADFYATGERASASDVLLVVEVSDSSLRYDRSVKLPLYARAGIAEFWIVDLKRRVLDAYRQPGAGGYGESTTHNPQERLALALAPDITVTLALMFG